MKPIRAFFAISLPESLQNPLKKILSSLKQDLPTKTIRWTTIENLHITLQFLREIEYAHLIQLIEIVRVELKDATVFQLELVNLELFPSVKRPRVVALQVEPHDVLADLSHRIGLGISAINYPLERGQFRGHLTLGRIVRLDKNIHDVEALRIPQIPKTEINEICLFESKTGHKSQIYIPLEHFKLSSPITPS
ncbi:RNA 2',3'-cyclic phosphodiesterase [Legionella micdadei]|uniref:RNA 2',3'-cyclic phosphodiesterase n=1 Tax=Legionella micdadei TaxID=451 RepID=A0A098GD94_LEGMI|nr:RNA 2',3'-cyclic phosphodiesterase [Legionella micdadei]ARG98381.1 2'-5' RNA ligase [Legionella micdadei]ARH01131.1 2'-5' RNA ligase [Legionella micdadei]KTD27317.1 RNA ligase/cyclic nucleotide phosphodiesterase [Legionella micdadei]NSL18701.1 RNA 2',3'-cyclic phosphodiesterase [Legionella micdadei]CEG59942.1 RNA ligase/cyclic nucleotide phosphodiesterase [Legionella micdadei]